METMMKDAHTCANITQKTKKNMLNTEKNLKSAFQITIENILEAKSFLNKKRASFMAKLPNKTVTKNKTQYSKIYTSRFYEVNYAR